MSVRAFDAVIFDFDGVIANSEPLHFRCFREVARENGIELSQSEYYANLIGYDDRGAWRKIFAMRDRSIDDAQIANLMTRKTEVIHRLVARNEFSALPGVASFIEQLHRENIPRAIYSGALRAELEPILHGLKLHEYFPIVTTADDVKVGKPDPSGYILTAQRLSKLLGRELPHERCLVIEDAPNVAARVLAEGFAVLGVTSSAAQENWPGEITRVPTLSREHLLAAKIWE